MGLVLFVSGFPPRTPTWVSLSGLISSWPALAATALLAYIWVRKSREEERLLAKRFPAYAEYRSRVRGRFLPWL